MFQQWRMKQVSNTYLTRCNPISCVFSNTGSGHILRETEASQTSRTCCLALDICISVIINQEEVTEKYNKPSSNRWHWNSPHLALRLSSKLWDISSLFTTTSEVSSSTTIIWLEFESLRSPSVNWVWDKSVKPIKICQCLTSLLVVCGLHRKVEWAGGK